MSWKDTVTRLIGKPFQWGGRGPDAYDCWGIVAATLSAQGLPVPKEEWDVPEVAGEAGACAAMEDQLTKPAWVKTDAPEPGDIVALSSHRRIHHVGVLTPFGILHTTKALGAVVEPESRLRHVGYRRVEYYKWVG